MASKKKQSEGIALLSMYNDEEEEEMEDVGGEDEDAGVYGEPQEDDSGDARFAEEDLVSDTDRMAVVDSGNEAADDVSTSIEKSKFGTSTQQQVVVNTLVSPQEQRVVSLDSRISKRGTLTIVDYGHDEVAMSPEPEEGEIDDSGRVMFGEQLHMTNGDLLDRTPSGTVQVLTPSNQANTPQFSEPLKSDTVNHGAMIKSNGEELREADQDEQKSIDPLDRFLSPPPKEKCSEELQLCLTFNC